ncbi:hypothetical protein NIES4072_01770 [Nostoc commune NIES-4072]|uniref:Uncharacterized protein n=1 Tax=Nostoc commune NIES-4072 TaxID=2005467 RepID=A0A2R5FL67_NOSCO|nr:hypothetical protein NIES4070_25050 [Nostoc commune HK-02]GBG16531.1 hypothetical protein NIES4072_01770 [Nostoc commune NIES-4072]
MREQGEQGKRQRGRGAGETRGQGDLNQNLQEVFPLGPNSPCPQVLFPMPNSQ